MVEMKFLAPLLLLGVIFVSGCASIPDVFGGDVIKVQTRSVEEGVKDSLVVSDILTIPSSPLLPDQEVVLSFIIENREKIRPVRNIRVDLFNAPGFKNPAGALCNSGIGVCRPEGFECDSAGVCRLPILLPGEQRLVQYTLKAPSRQQIANIKTQARLDFKVIYDFDGTLNFVIPAVNKDEIIRRQREGQPISVVFDRSFSSGPVRIDVEPLGVKYLLARFETILLFSIRNVGSGTIVKSEILPYKADSRAGAHSDSECSLIGGTCVDVAQGCQGTFVRFKCSGPADRQCCVPVSGIQISDCTSCAAAGGSWCQGESQNYCAAAGSSCLQGYEKASCSPGTIGSGSVGIDLSSPQGLRIEFPPELQVTQLSDDALTEVFGQGVRAEGRLVFTNKVPIQIFRDKSQTSLRFPVRLTDKTYNDFIGSQIPFRSYEIKSSVSFTYELRHGADVVVNAFENV